MRARYVYRLGTRTPPKRMGRKAQGLHTLMRRRTRVPPTWVCTWSAYREYQAGHVDVLRVLRAELERALDPNCRYAVRSSANVEDGIEHSFAGQFKTVLDVQGVESILAAIQAVWASAREPGLAPYLNQVSQDPGDLGMAVIVQEMVSPVVSGVSFSKNPMTGLAEVIVEAVRGSGEALVQGGITPERWVNRWGTWVERPAHEEIPMDLIQDVVHQTKDIGKAYAQPVDLEWVYDGRWIHWVQVRQVTALDVPVYSNRISREVFPGIINPLVWSVNVPLVNAAWVQLLTELIGPNEIDPSSLAGHFYYRAYFDMRALGEIFERLGFPRETLELLMGIEVEGPERPTFRPTTRTYGLLPRMLRFVLDKLQYERQVKAFLPAARQRFDRFQWQGLDHLSEKALLGEIDRLAPLVREAAYHNIVIPLHMYLFNWILKGQLRKVNIDFESLDLTQGMDELEQFSPTVHLKRLHMLYRQLDADMRARVQECSYAEFRNLPGMASLQDGLERFLQQFGHLSDSGNDFSSVPWRENPDLGLRMVTKHAPLPSPTADEDTLTFGDLALSPLRRWSLKRLYDQARRFRLYREAVSSLYTYGYGLFRPRFLALGDRLVGRGVLVSRDDIFYLTFEEVRKLVEKDGQPDRVQHVVEQRRHEVEQVQDIIPPTIIYGEHAPPVDTAEDGRLRGIPTSRGRYSGPVREVRGIGDLDKVTEGDVLVIPFSDVGWTPLFAKAKAVVAESGGILSHSSIIAREFGIPAVVSVPGACRLTEGTLVTVDGYLGEIHVHGGVDDGALGTASGMPKENEEPKDRREVLLSGRT